MNELLTGFGWLIAYIIVCVSVLILLRIKVKTDDEVFRKMLHCVAIGFVLVWVRAFSHWYCALTICLLLMLPIYPALKFAQRFSWFSRFFSERKEGEIISSFFLLFSVYAVVITVCWGLFQDKWLVCASIFAWGYGDAAAALIGKRFGKHKVNFSPVCGKKSYEGSAAMLIVSFVSVLAVLLVRGGLSAVGCIMIAAVTAFVSAAVELISRDGHDTVTCPMAAMVTLIGLMYAFGGI